MLDILWPSGVEVVDAEYGVPAFNQFSAQVRTEKSSATSNDDYSRVGFCIVFVAIVEMTIFNHLLLP